MEVPRHTVWLPSPPATLAQAALQLQLQATKRNLSIFPMTLLAISLEKEVQRSMKLGRSVRAKSKSLKSQRARELELDRVNV